MDEFLKYVDLEGMVNENDELCLIGHIRYSTSSLKHNQPFSNGYYSIVHNGVISQEPVEQWPYKTKTENDSELILKAGEAGHHPLLVFHDKSMAVCTLTFDGYLTGYRNHERPLWFTLLDNGIVFTSTKDIAVRAGLESPQRCRSFHEYKYLDKLVISEFYDHGHRDLQPHVR